MSTIRLLLIVNESVKKIITVPEDIDVNRLKELAANTFAMNPESIGLRCYDEEFEEWVLIPEDFVPKNKERIQVIPVDIVSEITNAALDVHVSNVFATSVSDTSQ